MGANVSPESILSRYLKPRATSLDLASTIHLCSSVFHVYTPFASITFSVGCYTGAKVPACSRPWNSLFMIAAIFPHAVTPPPQKRPSGYDGLTHVRLTCPMGPLMCYDSGWPHRLTLYSPAWTPKPHGPTSAVIQRTPAMLGALLGFDHESARASPHIRRVAVNNQRAGGMEPGVRHCRRWRRSGCGFRCRSGYRYRC